MPNLLKKIGILLSFITYFSSWAQVNVAPLATVTASSCNVGTCASFNNQNLGTCGQQQVWVSTAGPPSLVPGVNFIEWNWSIPYTMNQMTIHHGSQSARFLTGATIQYWDGTAWVNHHTFSNLPMLCSNTVSFPIISTNRMRITSFQMTGTGQVSNPNFREIEIFMTSVERNDAGVSSLLNENSLCIGNNNLNFRIQNFGVNTIDSVMLNWQVNGGTIQSQWVVASINSVINGPPPHSVDVTVGPATILSGANNILVWTSLPNDTIDGNPINDTLLTTLIPGISGNFTVNSLQPTAGNNFNSFTELATYLNTFGVCGPLVVDVAPGGNPYTERIIFNDIPGTSVINTITINGNGNTLTHDAPNSALRSTLTLDKVKHMSIDSLTIEATGNNFGWAMHLTNVSDSNSFTRCSFLSNDINFAMGTSGVVISSSPTADFGLGINGSSICFDRCLFSGGRYGLTANGIALNIMSPNLSITNSEFRNSSENGIRIRGFEKITIEGNRITRENRTDTRTYSAIYLQNCEGSIKISKNRIYGLNGLNLVATGIILSGLGSTVNEPIEISNNLIYDLDNLQSTTGIDVVAGTSYHMKIHHNTIVLNNLKANPNIVVRAYRVSTVSFTSSYEFLNNLVVLGGNSNNNRVYLLTAASASVSNIDNNVYFRISNLSALIGTIQNTNYPNFTDWQAAGYDPNGAFTNPDFLGIVGQSDFYRPTNLSLLGMGTNLLSRVPDDIEGAARSSMPDPGAFNIMTEQVPFDVGVAQLLYPDTVCGDSALLGIRIRNYGTEIIDSVMVSWQVNGGTIQSTWVSGPIDTANSVAGPFLDVIVGPANFPAASTNTVTTWTSLPNNQVDTITSNDTNNAIVISRLSGTVTINPNQPTGLGNFNSFTDFANEVNTNGICGPVIVNVAPGSPTFSERIVFNQISGMSAINTITINGNGNTLSHTASVSNQRATLLLNGTDHMTIDSLIVEATGANFGYAMQLTNQADSNTFFRCSFLVDENAVSINFIPVVISGNLTLATAFGNNANFNTFENCTMNGGNSGVIMFGSPTIFNRGNVLRNNTVRNFTINGIRVSHQEDLTLEYNDVSRIDKNVTNAFTGFAISNTQGTTRIYGNRIHGTRHPSSNANIGAIGISYSLNQNLDSTHVTLIANNLLYNFNNRGITRGFRIFGNPAANTFTQPVYVLHNTIVFEETAATLNTAIRAIEIFGNFANHTVANNLLYLETGSNNQVGLFFNLTTPSVNRFLDYNTFYLHNNVGNIATLGNNAFNSLAQWQTTGNGINSVVADPLFQRNTGASDFYRPTSATIFGTGMNALNKVPDDIELDIRPSLPDPGAFNIVICDSAPEIPHFADTSVLVCGSSDSIVVFLTPDSNATNYNWILPSGWSGNSNTDTILIWNINEHDTIYVYAENPCGLSDTLAIPIIRLDATLQASSRQICLGDTVNIGLLQLPHPTTDVQWNIGGSNSSISVSPTENTTYAITLSKDGRSCIDSVRIEVTIPDTILQTIQACDEYLWPADSLIYTTSGVYSTTLSTLNGCDSIVILDLTINQSDSTTLNVTECDTYFWNASGQTYNITGTYIATLSNQQGCDSVLILNLDILNSDSIVQMEVSCDSYFWPVNNQTFDSSGVYTEVFTKSNGCDSTHILILTINPSYSVSQSVVACDSFVWPANNQVYTLSGTYTDTLTTLSGCDSIVTLNLTINQSSNTTETITACDVFVWSANNQSYNTSGTYTAVLTNAAGCDSTITLNLSILQSDTISQTQSACDTYVWPVNNQSYSNSGVYFESFTKSNGCDSVMVLNLSIFSSSVTTQNIVACDSFAWPVNNQTYFASGTYIDTILSSAGCDSVINLELTINQSTTGSQNVTACNSYIWPDNNQIYNTSGVYTATLVNSTGCDSVVTLNLQINTNDTISHQVVACETYTWPVNNQTYTSTGVFQEVFTNAGGCDSVHILNLQIVQPDSIVRSQVACESYLWSETGITYNQSGTYSVTYTNFAGCDSVITLDLIVNEGVQIHQEVSVCDSYVWPVNGQTYTQSGTFSRSYTSSSGCDSIIYLHLSIFPSENTVQNVTANVQYFWAVNGRSYNRSGIYQHVLQTRNGCDSTIVLDLTIQEGSVLYVPSAFTPDGNRLNEEFKISGNDVATFHIHIFNRFGQLIFESDDLNRSWDGTHFGQLVPLGVYVYQITYTDTQGAIYTRKGTVTVLR
ncbi:MAG: gliding motility-associated C-terminal domain-containing protein [Flavobacteriales bacterium]|nr:MAG: gliding motility-associated C-terminal domain-containing protein [Flavobacteriales bacterium]